VDHFLSVDVLPEALCTGDSSIIFSTAQKNRYARTTSGSVLVHISTPHSDSDSDDLKKKGQSMKLSIARSELLEALNIVSKGMSARSTLPILSGIYLSLQRGNSRFRRPTSRYRYATLHPLLSNKRARRSFPASCSPTSSGLFRRPRSPSRRTKT
jgi:hypothetical protein